MKKIWRAKSLVTFANQGSVDNIKALSFTDSGSIHKIHMKFIVDMSIFLHIIFCKVFSGQTKWCGMTQKAVMETIRICKNRNVLREYLLEREKEVVTVMLSLFDEE